MTFLMSAFACAPADDQGAQQATTSDSSGVQIVSSSGVAREWTLTAAPTLGIGTVDGPAEQQFTRILSVLRLQDGRIVAANFNMPPELRIYSASGEHLRSIGRAGEGPGEFRAIAWARRIGRDTLMVYDPWTSRLTLFSGSGDLLGIRPIIDVAGLMPNRVSLRGVFTDGSLLGRPNIRLPRSARGRGRVMTPLLRVAADLEAIDTIVTVPDVEYSTTDDGAVERVIFGLETIIHPDGDRLLVGTADGFEVREYDLSGRHRRSLRWTQRERGVADSDVAALRDAQLASVADPAQRPRIEAQYRRRDVADYMPAYSRLLTDDEGNLWVRAYALDGEDSTWRIFSPEGELLATLVTPAQFRMHEIGSDNILGVWRDELDVESVRVYGLIKGT